MQYGSGQRPFNRWHGVQICYKINMLKNFPQVKCLREEQKDCTIIWPMEDVFAILFTGFWKSLIIFQLFPWVTYLMNGKAGIIFTITVACLALQAKVKDQVEQLHKIGVIAMKIGIDREVRKNRKVQDFVSIQSVIYILTFAVLFSVHLYWPLTLKSLRPLWLICHAVFTLCLGSFLLYWRYDFKSCKVLALGEKVWNILLTCFKVRLTTEDHKPAVKLRVSVGGP